ncbi:MAG: type 2 isopentenyl-diphosphate Delta-isomerase [Thermoplasmataceae archaeon]
MIENRKEDHIRIAENEVVTSSHNYWDDIHIIHQAIPEIDFSAIDTSTRFIDYTIQYPMVISSMTGGVALGKKINKNLAAAAERFQIPMGVGSMRAAVEKKELADTFSVILDHKIPVRIANIGAPQLINQEKPAFKDSDIDYVMNLIEANYLIVHFNFLQEMVQPEGDRNARGVIRRIREIAGSYPVIAKETGNGFSREAALELKDAGVKAIDVGGMGGTTFAAIEYYRAKKSGDKEKMRSGESFWNWGIPAPASIKYCQVGLPVIGSGGLRNGLDLARAIMFGAVSGGFARNLLIHADESPEKVIQEIAFILRDLKIAMFLTKSESLDDLRKARYFVSSPLREWLDVYD